MPSAIMTEDTWTENSLIRPPRPDLPRTMPDLPRAVPDSASGADEVIEDGGSDPVDEDVEADSQT